MRRCLVGSVLLCVVCVTPALGASRGPVLSEATLERAFESGCSLIVAEILSIRREGEVYYYNSKMVRTIVAGDLEKEQTQSPRELSAGASYGDALKTGSHYALFVSRDGPYDFAWAFRDDVIEVDPSDKEAIRRLSEIADQVYAKTAILRFRRANTWQRVEPPALADELASLCKQFREGPGRRAEIGRKIAESDLGSQIDDSRPESSVRSYLPPKISCSRLQILSLLGEPIWRNGWTYSWRCDDFVHAQEGGSEVGVLSATFDKSETAIRVLFDMQERSRWIRPARPAEEFAGLDGDPAGVARRFLEAMRQSNWDQALSLCSSPVKAKALRVATTEVFFRQFVPVKKLAAMVQFQPRGYRSRDGRVIEVSAEVEVDAPGAQRPVQWNWRLVREGATWSVDFALEPLDHFIRKELIRTEYQPDGGPRREMSDRDLRYILTPITSEFVIGRPMLLSLKMTNDGNDPAVYQHMSVTVNDPMFVIGPDGETIPYVDTSYQVMVYPDAILPGETIVLADKYDVTSQYRIVRPGRYTFQFRGSRPGGKPSNVLEVDVKPGPLPVMEQVIERLVPILPVGWRFNRHLVSGNDDVDSTSHGLLYIDLIGQQGGKGGGKGVLLMISVNGDPANTDPWLKEAFDFWGLSRWGPVYARVTQADDLWPNHKVDITRALEIKTVGQAAQ